MKGVRERKGYEKEGKKGERVRDRGGRKGGSGGRKETGRDGGKGDGNAKSVLRETAGDSLHLTSQLDGGSPAGPRVPGLSHASQHRFQTFVPTAPGALTPLCPEFLHISIEVFQ